MAVRKAVRAATTTFTAISIKRFFIVGFKIQDSRFKFHVSRGWGLSPQTSALSHQTSVDVAWVAAVASVVTVVNRRNKEQPQTKIVGVK